MMIGSISGGGFNFSAIKDSISTSNTVGGISSNITDAINPSGESGGTSISNSLAQPSGAQSPNLSSDTLNFLMMNSMDPSSSGGGDSINKDSISSVLAMANQAYGAATNLQSMSGSSVSGISDASGVSGITSIST